MLFTLALKSGHFCVFSLANEANFVCLAEIVPLFVPSCSDLLASIVSLAASGLHIYSFRGKK